MCIRDRYWARALKDASAFAGIVGIALAFGKVKCCVDLVLNERSAILKAVDSIGAATGAAVLNEPKLQSSQDRYQAPSRHQAINNSARGIILFIVLFR